MAANGMNQANTKRPWRRWLGRTALLLVSLLLLIVAHTAWVILSFDEQRLPARYGQVDAQLFLPDEPGDRPRPLLVLLGGAEGGNAWARERWRPQRERFAAQGYALLAIGYFGLPNTPAQLDRIAIEGVHAAILEVAADPRIDATCIAVLGGSRGAELALLLGSHYPQIDAVVALAPASAVFVGHSDAMLTSAYALNGQQLPFVPMPWSATFELITGDVGGVMRKLVANQAAMQAAAIAVERINGPILLVSGTEDEMWPATQMADSLMARLEQRGFAPVHEHWALPGGHAAPLQAFEGIEGFLARHFSDPQSGSGCGGSASMVAAED